MPIEVKVARDTIERWANPLHVANFVMRELAEKGAPVTGGLFPTSVSSGRVVIEEDDFGDLLVRWEAMGEAAS